MVRTQPYGAFWKQYYWVGVGLLMIGGVLLMGRLFLARHGLGPPLPHNDSVILEYVGWFLAQGNTLYVDIWEIKPPLAFLPPYLYALVTGSNMYLHHLLGIATTTIALAITGALTARIVGSVTDSPTAGLAAGVSFFALPNLFYVPWLGYKAKIMVFVFGLAALDRALHERFVASGFCAGLAVGFWQLAIVFPILTLVAARLSDSATATRDFLKGTAGAGFVILGTLLLYADVGGFLAEVVFGPLVLSTEEGPFRPGSYFGLLPGTVGGVITIVGVLGHISAVLDYRRARAATLSLGGLLTVGVLLIDFDGAWDAVLPLVFTALGVGLFFGYLSRRTGLVAVVVLGVVLSTTFAPSPLIRQAPMDMTESDGNPPALDPAREYTYWNAEEIDSCRFFGGGTQRSLLQYYPDADTLREAPCGNARLYATVLIDGLLSGSSGPHSNASEDVGRQTEDPPPTTRVPPTRTSTPATVSIVNHSVAQSVLGDVMLNMTVENTGSEPRLVQLAGGIQYNGSTRRAFKQVTIDAGETRTVSVVFDIPWNALTGDRHGGPRHLDGRGLGYTCPNFRVQLADYEDTANPVSLYLSDAEFGV